MDSSKIERWIMPFKKFGRLRVEIFCVIFYDCVILYHYTVCNHCHPYLLSIIFINLTIVMCGKSRESLKIYKCSSKFMFIYFVNVLAVRLSLK